MTWEVVPYGGCSVDALYAKSDQRLSKTGVKKRQQMLPYLIQTCIGQIQDINTFNLNQFGEICWPLQAPN
jgi:hypothetical protein